MPTPPRLEQTSRFAARIFLTLAAWLLACGAALAEPARFEIPSSNWGIAFEAPPLSAKQERRAGEDYAFRANSGRFNISFFVEKPRGPGSTHMDVQRYYWTKSSANPLIDKDSIVIKELPGWVRVQYDLVIDYAGRKLRQRHVNYYIAYEGKWVDVHISILEPEAADEQVFGDFDRSLKLGGKEA